MKKYIVILILSISFGISADTRVVNAALVCDSTHTENELVCENGIQYKWTCVNNDLCSNLPTTQYAVPTGYTRDDATNTCDICPNIPGDQATVPATHEKNYVTGNCIADPTPPPTAQPRNSSGLDIYWHYYRNLEAGDVFLGIK